MAMYQPPSFWTKYGTRTVAYVVGVGVLVILVLIGMGTCSTSVKNTEAAIVVNNITGAITQVDNGGMILHLPFGLSSVYKIDKSQRVLYLVKEMPRTAAAFKDHPNGDPISIKTNDGSNVEMDVEVVYAIQAARAADALKELGPEDNIEDILRALTRSEIRNEFGELSTLEIADASLRSARLVKTETKLREALSPLGISIESINTRNFRFDPEYDKIILLRKEADQNLANQSDYQRAKNEEGKRLVVEATRDKTTTIAQLEGDMAKLLLTAQGDAKRIITRAETAAYQSEREGESALAAADQEAAAVLAEGVQKAEAMEKLFEAYEVGGDGLVKEALVKLFEGVIIHARPYAPSDQILQIGAPAPAKPAATKGK